MTEDPTAETPEPLRPAGARAAPDGEAAPVARAPSRVAVVFPAYNAARTLEQTVCDLPRGAADYLILVDDASTDDTADVARRLGLDVVVHDRNRGYGANQKTCYRKALETDAGIVVMLHPDYQYDPRLLPAMVTFVEEDICDVMLGCRIRTRREALDGGMPRWKYLTNRVLTFLGNVAMGQNLGELHSGYRVYRREVLERVPFENNSDDFVFDSQFLAQCAYFGFRLGDVPVPVRYFAEASSINFPRSLRYGWETVLTLLRYLLARAGIHRSPLFRSHD